MGGDCGMQIFWLAQKVKQAESIDGVPEYIAGAFKDAVELAKALNMERLRLAADREPLAWTKERPTEPGWYLTEIEGDEESLELTWISELEVSKDWSSKMRFFGPIPERKEAS